MTDRAALFSFSKNTLLRAGAGTGKTEALATLYLHLVGGLCDPEVWPRQGVLTERIVALTFTEKAAVEMRERIAEAVRVLSYESAPSGIDASDPRVRERAARQWAQSRGLDRAAQSRLLALGESAARQGRPMPERATWQRVGFALGNARIGTFHGFASGALRTSALDLGIDPAFRVSEQEEADRLLRESVTEALSSAARSELDAVADLMAAAGGLDPEGDRGIVVRFVEMVHALDEAGVSDEELTDGPVLDATPPQPFIAADAIERFARACESSAALNAESWPQRMLKLAKALSELGVVDSPERARACVALLRSAPLPAKNRTRHFEAEALAARSTVESLHNAALAVHSAWLARAARGVLIEARARFRAAKKRRHILDFADLLRRLRDALRDDPRARRAWKRRFDAVLVDEFQDTNRLQRDLLYLLRERRDRSNEPQDAHALRVPFASELEPSGLLLVGDAKQSIYAFRSADVGVFLETERDLVHAGGVSQELVESHRSVDAVLEAINPAAAALLGAGLTAHGERIFDPTRDALVAEAAGDGEARVELVLVSGETADEIRALEAQAIARRIKKLVDPLARHAPGWRAPRLDEIAVLVPTWSHTEPVKKALQREGVPYAQLGGPGFWERREVDDLIALLRLVADPADRLALASVLRGPLVALSDAALAHVLGRHATLDDVLDPPPSVRDALAEDDRVRLDDARPSIKRLARTGGSLPPDEVLRIALAERNYAAVLAALPFGAQRAANVDKLVGLAQEASSRGGEDGSVAGFVRYVDRMRAAAEHETEVDVADVSSGAVQLLSIHAAKGLEWPVVFVAQTSRRRKIHAERVLIDARKRVVALPADYDAPQPFQDLRRDAHAAEEDDQRRLLYVALTRARDLAIVSGPAHEGDGEWRTLSSALLKLAPAHVRVIKPGLDGPSIGVRASVASAHTAHMTLEVASELPVQPQRPRTRRLAVHADALNEFARCPRRYAFRYELGAPEERTPGAPARSRVEALVRTLVRAALPCAAGEEGAAVHAALAAESEDDALVRDHASKIARAALAMGVGRALSEEFALSATGLASAIQVEGEAVTAAIECTTDLIARADALGGPDAAIAIVRVALDGTTVDPSWWREELESARVALATRLGDESDVRAAVWLVSPERSTVHWLEPVELDRARAQLAECASQWHHARESGEWSGRPLALCERVRCAYVARCHR